MDDPQSQPPKRPRNEMECLVQQARTAGLLHGDLGRRILGDAELYKEATWLQLAGLVVIIGVAVLVALIYLKAPGLLVLIGFGIMLLGAIYCLVRAAIYLVREFRIRHGSDPDIPATSDEYLKDLIGNQKQGNEPPHSSES